jgi:ankyrin repeat protein
MPPEAEVFEAAGRGDAARVKALLEAHPDWVNARNESGDSLLLAATYAGRRDIFDLLLLKGAAVNLFEAVASGLEDRVASFLEQDPAAANSYSHDGWTPLHLAAFFGHAGVAERLIARGADVNARSKSERFARSNTPLHAAAANRQVEVAELLLDHGADVNARDGSGFTPLALAASSKSDLLILMLLERGAQST